MKEIDDAREDAELYLSKFAKEAKILFSMTFTAGTIIKWLLFIVKFKILKLNDINIPSIAEPIVRDCAKA